MNRPFYFAPRREYRLRGFYFAFGRAESKSRFNGRTTAKGSFRYIHTPRHQKTPPRPKKTPQNRFPPRPRPAPISPHPRARNPYHPGRIFRPHSDNLHHPSHTTHHPPSTLNTSLPSLPPPFPSIKWWLTGRKRGAKPYKTPQNRRIHELSKTIQNSPKPPKISSSPVFI